MKPKKVFKNEMEAKSSSASTVAATYFKNVFKFWPKTNECPGDIFRKISSNRVKKLIKIFRKSIPANFYNFSLFFGFAIIRNNF